MIGVILAGLGCNPNSAIDDGVGDSTLSLVGTWRAVLTRLPDAPEASESHQHSHELPFTVELEARADGGLDGYAVTDHERVKFSAVEVSLDGGETTVVLASDGYDSELTATLEDGGKVLRGGWRKTADDGNSRMAFVAHRDAAGRFSSGSKAELVQAPAVRDYSGEWTVTFTDEDGESPGRGIFEQNGRHLTGTFRTPTGDYRWLEGEVVTGDDPDNDEELRLSTFDGAHAFLFHARFLSDQDAEVPMLEGDFWSRDKYHATWTARPTVPSDELPNPFQQVGLTNDEGRFAFSFPSVDGTVLSSDDPRFEGKVLLVEVFGSWCPNCNDSAPFLATLYDQFHDQGLEMVGLAYEMTGKFERDAELVKRYAERHGVKYPLLVAGTSDKQEAAATLPDLEAVLSFPTKIFIDRRGKVREIYSGYEGPSTGDVHTAMKASVVEVLEGLLAEKVR